MPIVIVKEWSKEPFEAIVESALVVNTYHFVNEEQAVVFMDDFNKFPMHEAGTNYLRAFRVNDDANDRDISIPCRLTSEAVPLALRTVYYDHSETPKIEEGRIPIYEVDALTSQEVEAFRVAGTHKNIVFAYDNFTNLEPANLELNFSTWLETHQEDTYTRLDLLGRDVIEDESCTLHISFDPDIVERLLAKYGHTL